MALKKEKCFKYVGKNNASFSLLQLLLSQNWFHKFLLLVQSLPNHTSFQKYPYKEREQFLYASSKMICKLCKIVPLELLNFTVT